MTLAVLLGTAAPVASAAPAWLAAQSLSAPQTPGSCNIFGCVPGIGVVEVGSDAAGNTTVIWARRFAANDLVLQATTRPAGGVFAPPRDIGPVANPFFSLINAPQLAVDAQGNGIAVWADPTGAIKSSFRPAGGSFGTPTDLSTGNANLDPHLAMSRGGHAVVAWIDGTTIRAASRAPGGGFGASQAIGATGGNSLARPAPAVNDSGAAAVAWGADPGDGNTIVQARVRPAGSDFLATPVQALSAPGRPAGFADVEIDAGGRFTVIWTRSDGTNRIVETKAAPPSGAFGAVDSVSEPGADANFPDVALDADNTAVAVWVRGNVIESAARPSGSSFTAPQLVSAPGTSASVPHVAIDAASGAVATWTQQVGGSTIVQTARRPAHGTFGSVQDLSANAGHGFVPQLAADDEGNAVIAWTQLGGDNQQVAQLSAFDAAPPTLTGLDVPGSAPAGQPVALSAAAFDRWSPVTIGWSFGDGATGSGSAVAHAFRPGAFTVGVTATDAVGNTVGTSRSITAVAMPQPSRPPMIKARVRTTWGVAGRKLFLLRLSARNVPARGRLELRCRGKRCPFKRRRSAHLRHGRITLFKELPAAKASRKRVRRFRAKQRLEVRVTAPGYIGKAVRYRLKRGRIPTGRQLCLPIGAGKAQRRCP